MFIFMQNAHYTAASDLVAQRLRRIETGGHHRAHRLHVFLAVTGQPLDHQTVAPYQHGQPHSRYRQEATHCLLDINHSFLRTHQVTTTSSCIDSPHVILLRRRRQMQSNGTSWLMDGHDLEWFEGDCKGPRPRSSLHNCILRKRTYELQFLRDIKLPVALYYLPAIGPIIGRFFCDKYV